MKFNPPLDAKEVELALPQFSPVLSIPNGVGGQGEVFRGTYGDRDLAIKIYYPGATSERTDREFAYLSRTKCQNLASIHSCGVVRIRGDDCIYSATPFINGLLLSQIVKNGPQGTAACAKIGCDIALAIDAMWEDRVVHRDIKPSNIIVNNIGISVLFDLGIARHMNMESLTTIGHTWGTPGYMAPEHARAMRLLSCKADIFSLGIVLQECLLGRHPVGGNQRMLADGGIPTLRINPNTSEPFAAIIDSMLAKEAHKRPTPSESIKTLKSCI